MTPNHLIHEKSPYLMQHAHNPVDWHPWGPEAFEKARSENKPILVSIGYSTCHWCHVMEKESFSNPEIAAVMNRSLVCVKVDREERPDVDKIYMTAVTAMTGAGGWPLNVFLTPDLKPFFGGTYFPPDNRWGRIGWPELVERISQTWQNPDERTKIVNSADDLTGHIARAFSGTPASGELDASILDNAHRTLASHYDAAHGGFGQAPKFPMPGNLAFLLRYHSRAQSAPALEIALATLRAMARGGICDQIGGGFHRYSTDESWHVPHFEKMLYDNAQLAANYLEAFQITQDPFFARVARETLDYVLRDMAHPDGGFFSAEDADSLPPELAGQVEDKGHEHRKEGAFYVWSRAEVMDALGPELGQLFCFHFGVEEKGNVKSDPHGEFGHNNVLYAAHTPAETAKEYGKTEAETEKLLEACKEKLFRVRDQRPRPHLDDKVLTSWNGLMISAFAKGHQVLGEQRYLIAAQRAAGFILTRAYEQNGRQLYHRWRDGERKVKGQADDYAFFTQGLLDLYEASFEPRWLDNAFDLAEEANRRFLDPERGGFYMTEAEADLHLIVRVKEDSDNVEPSASSVAALNLLRLARISDRKDFSEAADKTLKSFAAQMRQFPGSLSQMLAALDFALGPGEEIVVLGNPEDAETQGLLRTAQARFLPRKVLLHAADEAAQKRLSGLAPFVGALKRLQGKSTVYLCVNHACKQPISGVEEFREQLENH